MISKEDVLDYFNQIETKVKEIEAFYDQLFEQVKDIDLREKFLRLKGEEKVDFELVLRLRKIVEKGWKTKK